MQSAIIRLLANAIALAVAIWLVGGLTLSGDSGWQRILTLIIVAAIFGVINAVIKPIVKLVAIPLFILTLGLITFVINALMLWLTSWVAGLLGVAFHVSGFWPALLGALIVTIVSWLVNVILPDELTR